MIEPGHKAPALNLPDQDGRKVNLADLRGRTVVVTFYAEDFTPVCTAQVCGLRDAVKELAAREVEVLAVSPDPPARHAEFARAEKLPFRLLSDPTKATMRRWEAWGEKSMYGNIVDGVLRNTYIVGPDGRIAAVFRRIRTKGHAERVLKALDAGGE